MFFFHKKSHIEPFVPLVDLKTRRETVKHLVDTATPEVVDKISILLHDAHRKQLIRDLYKAEAKK